MSYLKDLDPEMNDEVKNIDNPEVTGTVIAKYVSQRQEDHGATMLDIRSDDNKIYYGTPMVHWEVTKLNEDGE